MAKVYLECEESVYQGDGGDIIGVDGVDEETGSATSIMPLAMYRNPIEGGKELDVDFDTTGLTWLYIVIVIYTTPEETTWCVPKTCKTRREAKKIHDAIASGMFKGDAPWDDEDCQFDECIIAPLPIED